ncbi:MAG: hypothetical protein U0353_13870 [Sandaracinus sp.]
MPNLPRAASLVSILWPYATPTMALVSAVVTGCGASHGSGEDTGVAALDAGPSVVIADAYVPPGVDAPFFTDVYVPPGVDGAIVLPDAHVPPGVDAPFVGVDAARGTMATVGTPCESDADCPGLFCSPHTTGFGYCSWLCADTMPCPGGAVCAHFDPAASYGYCMSRCDPAAADCPMGNRCQDGIAEVPVCYPGCTNDVDCPAGRRCGMGVSGVMQCYLPGAEAGQSCTSSAECPELGYCLDEATWGTPGGLCATFCDLATSMGCGAGTTCVAWGFMSGAGACIPTCDDTTPCRAGYDCVSTGAGRPRACVARCMTSADCTDGRECNFVTGRCG